MGEGGAFPYDPVGPPLLTLVRSGERAGLFTVDLSDAAPQPADESGGGEMITPTQPEIAPVVFLFKIEEMSSHNISYIWMVIDERYWDKPLKFAICH